MCIKCDGKKGKQITIRTGTLIGLGKLKKDLGFDCLSDLMDHAAVVLKKDIGAKNPVVPKGAQKLKFSMVRSGSGCPVHLVDKIEEGAPTLCGRTVKLKWQVVSGVAGPELCDSCRLGAGV